MRCGSGLAWFALVCGCESEPLAGPRNVARIRGMVEPTNEELQVAEAGSFDTETLRFRGMRGNAAQHLTRAALEAAIAQLEPAPRDEGKVVLLVARGPSGERKSHNGCKKWAQRFGLAPMQMHFDPAHRRIRLRGIYFQVVEAGRVRVGDAAVVLERPQVS